MPYHVYIMASRPHGAIYTGVTNDLVRRANEHRNGLISGFTEKYQCKTLVWYEEHQDINEAILREKRIKKWNRAWKIELIEASNPSWEDLLELAERP
ncbi:GIY-YIG nuclease family protein [uncultured Litoreibacter sp.]|uniref:GIY-YIG nuclease family protein n=1 Tax=uncultured Litoreibacter sp. TaxID=1392394 RepID=UPI00261327B4|nr:GIY-YIG nuclease family protein [uncultured Litoreibacter sp.]